jgi:hypothetical protein
VKLSLCSKAMACERSNAGWQRSAPALPPTGLHRHRRQMTVGVSGHCEAAQTIAADTLGHPRYHDSGDNKILIPSLSASAIRGLLILDRM